MQIIERDVLMRPETVECQLPEGVLRRVKYPVMRFGQKNRNGRVYEKAVAEAVTKDPEVQEKIKNRNLFGDCEHPNESALKLDPDKTSHVIVGWELDENTAYSVFDILDTKPGQFIDVLFKAGCGVGTSTRADGELEEKTDAEGTYHRVIPEKYKFLTVDFTADPSTPGSYPVEVQKNVEKYVRAGLESKRLDRGVAQTLMESIHMSKDAIKTALNEADNAVSKSAGVTTSAKNAEKAMGEDDAKGKAGKQSDQQNKGSTTATVATSQKTGEKGDGEDDAKGKAKGESDQQNKGGEKAKVELHQPGVTRESKTNEVTITTSATDDAGKEVKVNATTNADGSITSTVSTPANIAPSPVLPPAIPAATTEPIAPEGEAKPEDVLHKEEEMEPENFESLVREHKKLQSAHAILLAERNKAVELLESNSGLKEATESFAKDITALTEKYNGAKLLMAKAAKLIESQKAEIKKLSEAQAKAVKEAQDKAEAKLNAAIAEHKQAMIAKYAETLVRTTGIASRLSEAQMKTLSTATSEAEVDRLLAGFKSAIRESMLNAGSGSKKISVASDAVRPLDETVSRIDAAMRAMHVGM